MCHTVYRRIYLVSLLPHSVFTTEQSGHCCAFWRFKTHEPSPRHEPLLVQATKPNWVQLITSKSVLTYHIEQFRSRIAPNQAVLFVPVETHV